MEFAVCPSCKQSVLDDDAVDCPFCGSSMKAKPGAAKSGAKPAAAAPVKAAAITAPARSGPATKTAAKAKPDDDSAFDFSDNLPTTAIPASATRSKSRPLEVKCPMCETTGYVSPDAAGQAVKCANPKCMVPVFTAPKPEPVKAPEPPPPKQKRSLLMVGGITAAAMAIGGAIAWVIAGVPSATVTHVPTSEELEMVKQYANRDVAGSPADKQATPKTTPKDNVGPKVQPVATAATTASWLSLMNDTSLQQRQNRSKPYCRRLTAEAFAQTGDLDGARSQLESLAQVGREVPFYAVSPLVEIAWQQLAKGDQGSAQKTMEEALAASARLPKTGRDRLQTAIVLAAALIAVERDADAAKLLAAHQSSDAVAQLAQRNRAVQSFGTFNLDEMNGRDPALPWRYPLSVGVMYELVARNQFGKQPRWIPALTDARLRAESTAAYFEANLWQRSLPAVAPAVDEMLRSAETLPSPGDLLAVSRLGIASLLAGNQAAAEDCLTKAKELAAAIALPEDVVLPDDLKALSKFQPPDSDAGEFHAAAIAEAAMLAARLGQTEPAAALLTAALAQCRGIAPGLYDVEQRTAEIKSGGITALRARLKDEWKLKTDNDALVAATTLQKNLDELADDAKRRAELQTQLLTQAVGWGLTDYVWTYIRRGSSAEDAAQADYLLYTPLTGLLAEQYRAAGNQERLEVVTAAWKQLNSDRPFATSFGTQFAAALPATEKQAIGPAVELLQQYSGKPDELDDVVLPAVGRLAAKGRIAAALQLAAAVKDSVVREECYLLIAGMTGRRGETTDVEKQLPELTQATEKIAILRGLIGGRLAAGKNK